MMCQHVGMEVGLLVEAFVAPFEVAEERLLSCVDAQVRFQVEVKREFFTTQLALIRFLPLYN